jgi:hypothetical protein
VTLEKPDHLRPPGGDGEEASFGAWLAKRKLAAIAGVLGILSFLAVSIATTDWQHPDPRVSVPGLALTAIASVLSLVRREPKGYFVWAVGLALAGLSVVLGWFLMMAVVVAGVVLAVLILNALM